MSSGLLALALCGCTSGTTKDHPASPSPRRAPSSHVPPGRERSASSGDGAARRARCKAGQLTASVGQHGPANGTENVVIVLRNTSTTVCLLDGLLPLTATNEKGDIHRLGFHASSDPAVAAAPPNASGSSALRPGQYAAFILTECLTAGTKCATSPSHYVTLHVRVADGLVDMPYPHALTLGTPGTEGVARPVRSPSRVLGG